MPTLLHMCMHGHQVVIGAVYGMQAVKPVNIATIRCNRKWNLEENGLHMLRISRAGRDS